MLKKGFKICILFLVLSFSLSGCFSEKNTPFYDSEWIMQNVDDQNQLYYHHLILSPDHKVMLRVSYADSTNIIVWQGTYKINSKKLYFNFTECIRYEKGEVVGNYTAGQMIKFYAGEYLYSVGIPDDDTEKNGRYHLRLIRPKNFFYADSKDMFGNALEDFVKVK
ncbi:MAG: hypothetical protein PUC37_08050 [Spirochaetales bacterium]|nr:hypothetical protein [Spirochaetales bacterium]